MLKLREYRPEDAETIVTWVTTEKVMYQWSAHWISEFPVRPEKLNSVLEGMQKNYKLIPLTFTAETGEPAGFLFLRYPYADKNEVRLGFVIVDSKIRGKGYGKQMLLLTVEYATNTLGAEEITLGVFENNPNAQNAYKAAGFVFTGEKEGLDLLEEIWYSLCMRYEGSLLKK